MGGLINRREYKVLKYLREVRTDCDIVKKFGVNAVGTAINLEQKGFVMRFSDPQPTFKIVDCGENAISDFKEHCRSLRITSFWLPMIVSIATSLIINGLQRLLPLIQSLQSNTP